MARFGSIGTQYFDSAGDPLVSGKIYFYESGTSTFKDTYADVGLTILNTNPVILTAAGRQPNIFFNGSARALLTDSTDVTIEDKDPVGDTSSNNFDAWNSVTIYNVPDIVVGSDDLLYRSFINNNLNNNPTTSPESWEEVQFVQTWNINRTYALNEFVRSSTTGFVYRSLISSNIGNDPAVDTTNWGQPIDSSIITTGQRAAMQAAALSF